MCAPVIGRDLLTHLNMHLDCGTGQVHRTEQTESTVVAATTDTTGHGDVSCTVSCQLPTKTLPPIVSTFVEHHPNLVSEDIGTFPGFEHCIKLAPDAVPVAVRI